MPKEYSSVNQKQPGYRKVLITSLGILIVLIIVYFLYFRIIRQDEAEKTTPGFDEPAVAVIPISNYTCDPELEYISAGMHDALVTELGNINSLLVKSKNASLKYMDSELPLPQIASDLGVSDIVKTSLVCTEKGTQLLVQLMQVYPVEKEIWSGTYDQDFKNILTIYRDITQQLAKKMNVKLTPQEKAHLNTARPVKPELYKAYAQGVFYMNKLTPEGVKKGLKYFDEAITIDPSDPLPYVGLALGYSNVGHLSDVAADAPILAKEYALKALELDSTQIEVLTVLATDYLYEEWNWAAAEHALKRTIELNPNVASAHYNLGWYLALSKQWDKAESEIKRAVDIDPMDPIFICNLAGLYFWAGDYEKAISPALKTLELNSNFSMAYWVLGSAYAEMGMFDKAIEEHKKGIAISTAFKHGLGVAYARANQRKEALEIADELERMNNSWYTWGLAEIYAALGNKDKTIKWVKAAYEQHQEFVPWFETSPYFKIVNDDPRFREIIDRLDLPGLHPDSELVTIE